MISQGLLYWANSVVLDLISTTHIYIRGLCLQYFITKGKLNCNKMCANCEVCLIFTAMASSYGSLHTDLFQPYSAHNIVLRACNTLQIPILWLVIEKILF